ncbi:hypothetical protein [Candidatus Nitrososphaera gargensis]|uniref:hypothetical protein n=1 Tax=Candidatus Nitrososphaera gargensis TaxID=497727 RepID=UPI0011E54F7A|nr:hypothetical protein [Candidatus Nitrososphaera gargensis]
MTTQKCAACHRTTMSGSRYCLHHGKALESLTNHYKEWVDAYGGISWQDFLDRLSRMQETGSWVKEVIAVELKK